MFKKVESQVSFPQMEEEILKFWEAEKIFEKSIAERPADKLYSFYDGPPFATGTPHYGHIVASAIKDTVPRYFTMKGYRVERKWGWDCHGLPIENIAEKELGITHKKQIEELGVAKFNEICRSKVLEYVAEWKKVIGRFGRWADMEHPYKTMDRDFMESVWWVFKELWDKGLIYESYRTMHICPRCETTLSQSEVAEGYQDVKDLAVTVKFKLNPHQNIGDFETDDNTYILAWTTTPWTLPGNVALAVNRDIDYVLVKDSWPQNEKDSLENTVEGDQVLKVESKQEYFILSESAYEKMKESLSRGGRHIENGKHAGGFHNTQPEVFRKFKGSELVGKAYKPLFPFLLDLIKAGQTPRSLKKQNSNESVVPQFAIKEDERFEKRSKEITNDSQELWKFDEDGTAYKIYHASFVTMDMGTGIAHEAPAFGEEDMELGKKEDFPFVQHVKMDGTIEEEVTGFGGMQVKPKSDEDKVRFGTDIAVLKYLQDHGTFFSKENITHSYPHCWRCDTPLLNYATSSWFVKVTDIKPEMLELAKGIHWSPEHIKEGRWGKWLEGARDWSISRQRYWASVMPIWKCACGELRVFGSATELEKASGKKIEDLHKHIVDEVTFPCEKCGEMMHRIPDVLDTWFDSGSMPYAQDHYPFENEEKFKKTFPADFIAEGVDQTRAWFYYQHVIGTGIKKSNAFQNVIVNGIVLAEDGKKMSKRLKNYPDPMDILNKYGADALRYYLLSSPVVAAENLNFSERDLSDIVRNVFRMLWNSYSFFTTYAAIDNWAPQENAKPSDNLMDRWILSELQLLIQEVDGAMGQYELNKATRAFAPFVDNLSNWYIRRSRRRFWKPARTMQSGGTEDDSDKEQAYQTLYTVLVTLSKLMAPFTPFLAEEMYKGLTDEESARTMSSGGSVHLADYPVADESLIDEKLNDEMRKARETVRKGLQRRVDAGIKVRQPLSVLSIKYSVLADLLEIIKEEINVKSIKVNKEQESNVVLDIEITPELKLEGEMREVVRAIQEGRKKAKFNVEDRIMLGYVGKDEVFATFEADIAKEVLATKVEKGNLSEAEYSENVTLDGGEFSFSLKR